MINKKKLEFVIDSVEDIPGWMNKIKDCFGEQAEYYAERYIDEKEGCIKDAEKYYYSQELPKVREQMKEFIKEEKEFVIECRERGKKELQESFNKKCKVLEKKLEHFGNIEEKKVLYEEIEKLNKRLNSDISEEEIEKAKNYPFENLIESKKGFALCPFHDDHHPSFYIKNNYGYCFSCGKSVDTIQFIIETKNITFKEAVYYLNNM